jgi:GNAT superfamily N-acetyltransferase
VTVRIEPVDGATASEPHLVETEADERGPAISGRTFAEAAASYRNPGDAVRRHWLATLGGETAGAGFLSRYGGTLTVGYVLVRPVFRRRGIGRGRLDEARWAARGDTTVALEAGEVVALTGVRVPPAPAREAITDDTATVASARGRGLARAAKLENLRALRELRPDVERVSTRNAEQNAAIPAVNARIGFQRERTVTTAVLTL